MISIPAVGGVDPQRSGTPTPNTQYAKIVEHVEKDPDPSDAGGSEIQGGIDDKLAVTKTGDSNSPVKMEVNPAEASPFQMTLVAALQSTISAAHSVAQSNGDSARSLIAEAVEQIAKIQDSFTVGESDIERKLRELRESKVGDEDDEDEPSSDEDEDDDEPSKPKEEDGGEMRAEPSDDEDDEDEEEDPADDDDDEDGKGEKRSVSSVDAILREIRHEKGVPQINSVGEGLAYLQGLRK